MEMSERYRKVRKMIFKICSDFHRKRGGDFDILLSEAHEAFVLACSTYDAEQGEFTTWVWTKVHYALLQNLKMDCRRTKKYPKEDVDVDMIHVEKENNRFSITDFLDRLSDESQNIVKLAIRMFGNCGHHRLGDSNRRELYDRLISNGMSGRQVVDSFQEIRENLSC